MSYKPPKRIRDRAKRFEAEQEVGETFHWFIERLRGGDVVMATRRYIFHVAHRSRTAALAHAEWSHKKTGFIYRVRYDDDGSTRMR